VSYSLSSLDEQQTPLLLKHFFLLILAPGTAARVQPPVPQFHGHVDAFAPQAPRDGFAFLSLPLWFVSQNYRKRETLKAGQLTSGNGIRRRAEKVL
jgi:hypothetical protein